ncbi:CD209 antigen-like protein B isoform X2 [Chionomys nivalis]|uniref:CD209 antigen-like protein B isoform X2 n=1 Tax=Chionomys nivalis TaxID=269649 RepID=UPI002595BC09|nr:CD209 antigen-like protein B isoform X2 [Chionomys nivalis]
MSDSTEARMQQLGSAEDEEWMVSDTRCSNKSSRLRPHSGTKSLAVSKTPNTQEQEDSKHEEIVQELTQLKDQLCECPQNRMGSIKQKIPRDPMQVMTNSRYLIMAVLYFLGTISQGRNESSQISEQLMRMKAELLSSILNIQVQNHSKQEKIYQQLVQMKAELFRLCRPCPWDWTFLLGNCYFISKYQQNWSSAVKACQEVEAQLVIIQRDEEQSFLQQTSKAKGATWMGLSDLKKEGSWLWVDDSPLSSRFQKYWSRGEPNNIGEEDCVEFTGDGWNDAKCDLQKFWVCKKSATPCTAS